MFDFIAARGKSGSFTATTRSRGQLCTRRALSRRNTARKECARDAGPGPRLSQSPLFGIHVLRVGGAQRECAAKRVTRLCCICWSSIPCNKTLNFFSLLLRVVGIFVGIFAYI